MWWACKLLGSAPPEVEVRGGAEVRAANVGGGAEVRASNLGRVKKSISKQARNDIPENAFRYTADQLFSKM
jgi:hypothetical protein